MSHTINKVFILTKASAFLHGPSFSTSVRDCSVSPPSFHRASFPLCVSTSFPYLEKSFLCCIKNPNSSYISHFYKELSRQSAATIYSIQSSTHCNVKANASRHFSFYLRSNEINSKEPPDYQRQWTCFSAQLDLDMTLSNADYS